MDKTNNTFAVTATGAKEHKTTANLCIQSNVKSVVVRVFETTYLAGTTDNISQRPLFLIK